MNIYRIKDFFPVEKNKSKKESWSKGEIEHSLLLVTDTLDNAHHY